MRTYSLYFQHKRVDIKATSLYSAALISMTSPQLQVHGRVIAIVETSAADEDYLNFAFHLKED